MKRKQFLVVILSRLEKAMLLSPDGFFIICEKWHNFMLNIGALVRVLKNF